MKKALLIPLISIGLAITTASAAFAAYPKSVYYNTNNDSWVSYYPTQVIETDGGMTFYICAQHKTGSATLNLKPQEYISGSFRDIPGIYTFKMPLTKVKSCKYYTWRALILGSPHAYRVHASVSSGEFITYANSNSKLYSIVSDPNS